MRKKIYREIRPQFKMLWNEDQTSSFNSPRRVFSLFHKRRSFKGKSLLYRCCRIYFCGQLELPVKCTEFLKNGPAHRKFFYLRDEKDFLMRCVYKNKHVIKNEKKGEGSGKKDF